MDGQIEEVPPSVGVISAELSTMSGWLTGPPPGSRMSSTGTTISRSSSFERPASTSSISRPPADEPADLLERPLGRGQADPLQRLLDQPLEPLDRDGEVRAALRPCHGVHLVEDEGLDAAQVVARAGGQQQVERLGGRDQDVRRLAQHRRPFLLRRVAGADGDIERAVQAGQRAAQVPLDVVVERLERRDVQQAETLPGRLLQPVDPVQERRQRLARAGRRLDERMAAAGDRGPAELLRRSRLREGALEPGARLRGEDVERAHRVSSSTSRRSICLVAVAALAIGVRERPAWLRVVRVARNRRACADAEARSRASRN